MMNNTPQPAEQTVSASMSHAPVECKYPAVTPVAPGVLLLLQAIEKVLTCSGPAFDRQTPACSNHCACVHAVGAADMDGVAAESGSKRQQPAMTNMSGRTARRRQKASSCLPAFA